MEYLKKTEAKCEFFYHFNEDLKLQTHRKKSMEWFLGLNLKFTRAGINSSTLVYIKQINDKDLL